MLLAMLLSVFPSAMLPLAAQQVALKTNALYWATTTPNIAVEWAVTPRITLNLPVSYNAWNIFEGEMSLRHYAFQPEVRYWLCRTFEGHFLGAHAHYAAFDAGKIPFLKGGLKQYMFRGDLVGAGISYGYHHVLKRGWGIEFTVGAGYAYMNYKKYIRADCCAEPISKVKRHYFGPTQAAINLIYTIR